MHMRKKDYLTDVKIIFFSPAATDQLLSRTNSNPRERKDKRKKSAGLIFSLYMKDDLLITWWLIFVEQNYVSVSW